MTQIDVAAEAETTGSESKACLNCGTPVRDAFCASCGQKTSTTTLRLRELLRHGFEDYLGFDSKVIRTVLRLTSRPGEVCRDYIEGKRTRYVSPIRYFLTTIALTLVANLYWGIDPAVVSEKFSMPLTEIQRQVQQEVGLFVFRHLDAVVLLALPLLILAVRWLYRRAELTYAEVSVFVFYLIGHTFFLGLVLTPLKSELAVPIALAKASLLMVYLAWAGQRFFRVSKWEALMKGVLITGIYFVLVALSVTVVVLPRILFIIRSSS